MIYRDFAGNNCSVLGFGCMRFPTKDGKIDREKATAMLKKGIDSGINYFDTAYVYHNGESEIFVGEFLKSYPRDSYYVATKLPLWNLKSVEDAERTFCEQLNKMQLDHFDYFLLHALTGELFDRAVSLGIVDRAVEWKKQGKIKNLGFSFHDSYDAFEHIIGYREWDFCQIQYNYMDTDNQAGDKGLMLAESLGIPVVVMEPIRGGSLINFPDDIKNEFSALDPHRNLANFALSWVATHQNVSVVLSGMSTMEQVEDNLATFDNFVPLTPAQMDGVSEIVKKIRAKVRNGCTGCRYCMPCPAGVDIPRAFAISNEEAMHGNTAAQKGRYLAGKPETFASQCKECGACETKCPQHISIISDLKTVKGMFED